MRSVNRKKRNAGRMSPRIPDDRDLFHLGPHLLDTEVEPFCNRVSEFGNIIQGLKSKNEWEQKNAIRRADILLHGGSGEGSFEKRQSDDGSDYVVTEAGDGLRINTENKPGSSFDLGNLEKNLTAPIQKEHVLLEDGSDDEEGGSKSPPLTSNEKHQDPERESVQAAEQGILDLLLLPKKEEMEKKPCDLDDIARKEMSDSYRQKGTQAFAADSFADAVLNYTKAIELIPDNSYLYMNRAQAYLRVGIPLLALEDLKTALELNPNSLKAHLLKTRAYFNLSEPDKAKRFLKYLKDTYSSNVGMINAFEKDLFNLKMEKHLETGEEARQREELRLKNRIPMLSDLEEKWQKLGRHQLFDVEGMGLDEDENPEDQDQDAAASTGAVPKPEI